MKAKRVPDPATAKSADQGPSRAGATPKVAPVSAGSSGGAGLGTIAGSGLIGGVIGAGLFFALAQSGMIGPKTDDTRLAALDRKVADLAPRDAVSALDRRVATSEQTLKTLPDTVKSAMDRADEALEKAGSAQAPAATDQAKPAASASADLYAKLEALDQRVSALQEEPGTGQPADTKLSVKREADDPTRLADLDERLKALETKGGTAAPAADLTQTLATLQGDIESRTKVNETADKALARRIDELQQSLDARVKSATEAVQSAAEASRKSAEAGKVQAEEAAKSVDRRLGEQGDRLASLDKAVDGAAKAATLQATLRVVAAERIVAALNTGTPYADALASLRNADPGSDTGRFEALAPYADTGAPTAASLSAAFKPIAEKIAEARRAAKAKDLAETGGIADRLQAMAASVVQVKRTDASAPGPAAAATDEDPAAKVREALDRGRVAEAAQHFAALPEETKAQAGDFGAKLKARADADTAARALQSDAFKTLAAPAAGR